MTRRTFPAPPTEPRAVIVTAHPLADSFNHALADAWVKGAQDAGLKVDRLNLGDMDFNPCLEVAYRGDQPLEPDLEHAKAVIESAAHLTIAFPLWWGSVPAQLKGFFDRTFLPGWAFRYKENGFPEGGLAGRSGRVIVTMDGPTIYDSIFYRASARRQVAKATLGFCGIKPVKTTAFGGIKTSTIEKRERMIRIAVAAGYRDGLACVDRLGAKPELFDPSRTLEQQSA